MAGGADREADGRAAEGTPVTDASNGRTVRGPSDRRLLLALAVGLALLALGTLTASWIATSGGDVAMDETTIETESGLVFAWLLVRTTPIDVAPV